MDAGNPPLAPARRPLLRWHGAIVATLLVSGGACTAFGRGDEMGWLERQDWHLTYDTLGTALLWLGALGLLPQLAYALWLRFGAGHAGMRRRAALALGAVAALFVLALAPELSIGRQRRIDPAAYRDDDGNRNVDERREDRYVFRGLRQRSWLRFAEEANAPGEPGTRTLRSGAQASWRGTLETYRWHPLEVERAWSLATTLYAGTQPQGYECLEQRTRFFGPFEALHTWERVDETTDAATQSVCRRVMRFRGALMSPDQAMRAYRASTGDTPLASAVASVLPAMDDTIAGSSGAEVELTRWSAHHAFTWAALQALPQASARQDIKDIGQERGKLACAAGRLQVSSINIIDDVTAHFGVLVDANADAWRFSTARSMGALAEGSDARFCGVVIGRTAIAGADGEAVDTLTLVGMFDLPQNHP